MSGLILVQRVCEEYQHTTKDAASNERVKIDLLKNDAKCVYCIIVYIICVCMTCMICRQILKNKLSIPITWQSLFPILGDTVSGIFNHYEIPV